MEEKRTRIIRASASRFHSFFFHSTEIRDVSRYHHSRRFFVSLCDNAIRFHEKDLVQIQSPCTRYPPKIRCFARIRERKGQRCIIQRYTGRRKQDISLISILLRRYKSRGTRPRDSLRALVFLYFSFPSFSFPSYYYCCYYFHLDVSVARRRMLVDRVDNRTARVRNRKANHVP